ncbi:DNA replication and repair protein RecF [bioreactor metagenome]|uniref:DNA replication and repair protein RecF n=1 Tax=bioreactor metagenome TaxID=1076179 RepID=A0A644YRU3_9ZZZZ
MRVTGLRLVNFRNYPSLSLRPDAGLCVLTGENAAGKTNVLEALFLCSLGRSHRTVRDSEMVRKGEPAGSVAVDMDTRSGPRRIECKLFSGDRKKMFIDGAPLSRSGELLGCLNVVMFAPEDLALIKDGPGERRRFLDMAISQLRPSYYYTLQQYNAALKQRNALLKEPEGLDYDALECWDEQLSVLGAAIVLARAELVEHMGAIAAEQHETLSDGAETLVAAYEPNVEPSDRESLAKTLRLALADTAERDVYRGSTSVGPHRDDLKLVINGSDVRVYGSQGQQRTTVLSLKLAQLEILRAEKEDSPVLLLDDVFSELDRNRQKMLLIAAQDCQTFLTCTHIEEVAAAGVEQMQVYQVADRSVVEL